MVPKRSGPLTGVNVKVLGWIKSAIKFIKMPAGPRKDSAQPDAPHAIDRPAVASDARPDMVEIPAEIPLSPEPESRVTAEPESPAGAQSESVTKLEPESPTGTQPERAQDEEEIDRRRGIVRAFFNDYWSSVDEKPASFAERLDGAEGYINERVAARGEAWRLDAATRKELGLPRSRKG
jgi:hypothetical protein